MVHKSDGGPTQYYDFKEQYKTVNDILEDKGPTQWKEHSWHLSNIFKAVWRWGSKDGTTKEYDAKKIIYSGCRILRRIAGTTKMRQYLLELLDDPQFREKEDPSQKRVKYDIPLADDAENQRYMIALTYLNHVDYIRNSLDVNKYVTLPAVIDETIPNQFENSIVQFARVKDEIIGELPATGITVLFSYK